MLRELSRRIKPVFYLERAMGNRFNEKDTPEISVIIPVFNSGGTIEACLESIFASDYERYEVIVIDNGSRDGTAELAGNFPCTVLVLDSNRGAAYARNYGAARARGDVLVFLDSDVVVGKNTLALLRAGLSGKEAVAIGGIYSPLPKGRGLVTMYKNFYCHYVAVKTAVPANYFSTSCGGVYKTVFSRLGGFRDKFTKAGGEDIDFGYRLVARGYKTIRDKGIQVVHQKAYSFAGLIKNDCLRAREWIKILLEEKLLRRGKFFKNEADVSNAAIVSVLIAWAVVFSAMLISVNILYFPASIFFLCCFAIANKGFLGFVYSQQGMLFALSAGMLYFLCLLAGSIGGIVGLVEYAVLKRT